MLDDTIDILTEIIIKEHMSKNKDRYVLTKQELAQFCVKIVKEIQKIYG